MADVRFMETFWAERDHFNFEHLLRQRIHWGKTVLHQRYQEKERDHPNSGASTTSCTPLQSAVSRAWINAYRTESLDWGLQKESGRNSTINIHRYNDDSSRRRRRHCWWSSGGGPGGKASRGDRIWSSVFLRKLADRKGNCLVRRVLLL